MSWSPEEPEWRPVCQCQYDEARDEMFRGDCPLHAETASEELSSIAGIPERKPPKRLIRRHSEIAR